MPLELAVHCLVALSSRRPCDLVSCHIDFFCMSLPSVHFSGSSLPLPMGCGLPRTISSGYCHARSAAATPTQTFTATATTQPVATCEQLQLPSARPCTASVLYPVIQHSDSQLHTSLSLSACLLRHLRIPKGELVF